MIVAAGTASPSAYWYLTRGTGVVSLLLLSATVVLGVLDVRRVTWPGWPRFLLDRIHRDVSLLVLVALVVHIVTSILDGFAPIGVLDAVIPLHSAYRPLWLGLGALSFDLLLAVAITSLVRRRLGYRAWRVVHWLAYASWPVAVLHGLGTGSDARTAWMLVITAACVAAAIAAAGVRLLGDRPGPRALLPLWTAVCALTPVGVAVLAIAGPLSPNWARRAGTPVAVLRAAQVSRGVAASRPPGTTATAAQMPVPFTARLSGTVSQRSAAGGALVDLVLRCSGGISGELRVRMAGAPLPGAGLSMTGSEVQLTAVGLTSALQGTISVLNGDEFIARVRNAAGMTLRLHGSLAIDPSSNTVTGTLTGVQA